MLWTQQQAIALFLHLQFNIHVSPNIAIPILCLYKSKRYSFAVIGLSVVKQFIYGATFSLNCFPAENAGTLVAGIVIGSLVLGLRPSRSERSRRSNDPKPMSVTFSPLATASVTTDKKPLMISSACFFVMLVGSNAIL